MQNTAIRTYLHIIMSCMLLHTAACFHMSGQTLDIRYPWLSQDFKVPSLHKEDTLTLCFMGDVMMHSKQIENTSRKGADYDFSSFFSLIEDELKRADIAVANMEFTLAGEPYSGYPCFSAPDGFETYLTDCGFDLFLTANNHIFDKGAKGAERTLEKYRNLQSLNRLWFTGLAGSENEKAETTPLLIRLKGIELAFINFTYGTNMHSGAKWPKANYMSDKETLSRAIAAAGKADYIFALPHWGTEYVLKHSQTQEDMARWLVGAGVDAVIGAHPHVIQDYQEISDVPVVYSLGNAVSNMSAANTQLELMTTVRIVRHSEGHLEMLPLSFKYLWCSLPGGYNDSYTVIPVKEYLDKKEKWTGKWDYDKMVLTYRRVMAATGIPEGGMTNVK